MPTQISRVRIAVAAVGALGALLVGPAGGCGGGGSPDDGTGAWSGSGLGDHATTGDEGTGPGEPPSPTAADAGVAAPPEDAADSTAGADAGAAGPVVAADAGTAPAQPGLTVEAWQALVRIGRQRFNATCDTCHPGGDEDIGPRIIGKSFSVDRMRQQIRNGSGRMRPIPVRRLADEDLDALFAYLSTIRAVRGVERPR